VLAHDVEDSRFIGDDDLTFIPTLQYWGVPENPAGLDLRIWETQELFLALFARCGKFVRSATMAGITPQCVYKWEKADKFSFNKRMEIAHQEYVERLEADLDRFIEESPHNTQIAQMFRMKAEWPEKYRDEVKIVGDDRITQMLDRLTEIAARRLQQESQQLEQSTTVGKIIEGTSRPLPEGPDRGKDRQCLLHRSSIILLIHPLAYGWRIY
jgi:hypothetical protein